jgi:hypothetical protein
MWDTPNGDFSLMIMIMIIMIMMIISEGCFLLRPLLWFIWGCRHSLITWLVSDCTVNYRPVIRQRRRLWKKNKVIVRRRKKSKIKSGQGSQREARYPDELVDWLSIAWNWTCVIALQITDPSSRQRGRPTWKINKVIATQITLIMAFMMFKKRIRK